MDHSSWQNDRATIRTMFFGNYQVGKRIRKPCSQNGTAPKKSEQLIESAVVSGP
jgi:hypothetical protein